MSRQIPRPLRERLFSLADGRCQCEGTCGGHDSRCQTKITIDSFDASHLRARANGGSDDISNLEAWCQACNLALGTRTAKDNRALPRPWQRRELERVVAAIAATRSATLSAAPGSGKTVFACFAYEALRELGLVERMLVVVPRRGLAQQWARSLYELRHVDLKPNSAVERHGQDGVVVTYQSLAGEGRHQLETHITQARRVPTLLVLDEPHHLGQDLAGQHKAWARAIAELAGDVEVEVKVAGVLNISGTLWRSKPSERISTVRYAPADEEGKITTLVDSTVTVEELILANQLRPVDLYRLDAKVQLSDYQDLRVVAGNLSDLDEKEERATLASLGKLDEWRTPFVAKVLALLEDAHRALDGYHAKALIVAARQTHAHAFRDEVDRQMRAAGRAPLAVVATSDDPDAQSILENFRRQQRVGVLCTVDMAGEGYDCPEIAVIGYATNKATTLYVRQVAARAMRVTAKEAANGYCIPAMIVLPDAATLVEQFVLYMGEYTHELIDRREEELTGVSPTEFVTPGGIRLRRFELTEALAGSQKITVPYADGSQEDLDAALLARFDLHLRAANVPPVLIPRVVASSQRTIRELLQVRPFDTQLQTSEQPSSSVTTTASIEDQGSLLQQQADRLSKTWAVRGDTDVLPVSHLNQLANTAAGIPKGGRPTASVAQLRLLVKEMKRLIDEHGGASR